MRFRTFLSVRSLLNVIQWLIILSLLGFTVSSLVSSWITSLTPNPFIEFEWPGKGTYVGKITAGPDGALWVTTVAREDSENQIGRITRQGKITLFSVPAA